MLRLAATCTAAAALAASAAAGSRPLVTTRLPIQALAQDANRIAWMSGGCYTVRIRALPSARSTIVGNADASTCEAVGPLFLALGGRRALWVVSSAGNNVYSEVVTGTARHRNHVLEEVIGASSGSDGEYVTDVAGDGGTLVYSVISMSFLDTCIDPGEPCDYFVDGGRVMRLVGDRARRIPGLPPVLALAASGKRIALVVAAHEAPDGFAAPTGEVEVRDAGSGGLVATAKPHGAPLDVALGTSVLAVATKSAPRAYAVECFRAGTAAPLARIDLPGAPLDLSVSGRRVLVRTGRVLRIFDAVEGTGGEIAVARRMPLGASIEGRRVVWAESGRGRSRIEEITAG